MSAPLCDAGAPARGSRALDTPVERVTGFGGRVRSASRRRVWIGALLAVVLASPPMLALLESSMTTHLAVQMPLLVAAGVCLSARLEATSERHAGPALALALPVAAFWMLPSSMDSALDSGWVDLAKLLSLIAAVGVPLGFAWRSLGPVTRAFWLANLVSMLAVLGWLYSSAPARLCSFYLRDDQSRTGLVLLLLALTLGVTLALRSFCSFAPHPSR